MRREKETERSTPTRRRKPAPQATTRPPQEEIRVLAHRIYESRRMSGTDGDPVSDWLEAERRLAEQPGRPARKSASKAKRRGTKRDSIN